MRIAIVDDEDYFADLLLSTVEHALGSSGITDAVIDRFSSAEEIMDQFQPDKYQLIFLDIYMGEKTGIDAARYIRTID